MIRRRAPTDQELATAVAVPLLQPFTVRELETLVGPSSATLYEEDTQLFSAGDPADRFFVVIAGSVRLYATMPDGRETTIALITAPASFTEAAMFSSGGFPVNAAAAAGTLLLNVGAKEFLGVLDAEPERGLEMLRSMRRWELLLLEEIRQVKTKSPLQRLAGFMLSLCGEREGEVTVRLPVRKTLLAQKLGIKPETLSRNLQRLAASGVTSTGDTVNIPDTAILLRIFRGESAEA